MLAVNPVTVVGEVIPLCVGVVLPVGAGSPARAMYISLEAAVVVQEKLAVVGVLPVLVKAVGFGQVGGAATSVPVKFNV